MGGLRFRVEGALGVQGLGFGLLLLRVWHLGLELRGFGGLGQGFQSKFSDMLWSLIGLGMVHDSMAWGFGV